MKKSLLAVAALTAFAGAAQAQSSVTVYGILDMGYQGSNDRVTDSLKANTAGYNGGNLKRTSNQFGASAEQTSRLGFKGVEDMGGGTSAFFTVEFQLYPQDQTLSGNSSSSQSGGLLNRQSFVGLRKNGIGQTALGMQYTPVFNLGAVTDPGQNNNMAGNVTYTQSTPNSGTAGFVGSSANNAGYTVRTANTLSVKSANFSGFTASAIYTLNARNATETYNGSSTVGGNTNSTGWGLAADFTYNKFYIGAAYQALKSNVTANGDVTLSAPWSNAQANGSTTAPLSASGTTLSGQAFNVQDNQFLVGTTYDFGILKAYGQYLTRNATSTLNSNYYLKRSAEQIGVRGYITPTVEAWLSGGLGRYTAFGSNTPTVNFNGWQLGSNYWLSKRTNLYAIYGQTLQSTGAYQYSNGQSTTTSGGISNYAIGVRHTF